MVNNVKVLVNVEVGTEGFDLPDASCIIIARPTMSLALYLQMVGRGLRPKPDGGDCRILDLAANSLRHGLPEDYREWTLKPRGRPKSGEAPIVVCPQCEAEVPASSHKCPVCCYAFGKHCDRCGRWRAHSRWSYETLCGDESVHQLVCDFCHIDAHIEAHLPVVPPLGELVDQYDPEDEMTFPNDIEINDDLANSLSALFKELLEAEQQNTARAADARRAKLRRLIEEREAVLSDNAKQYKLFKEHIAGLPEAERPTDLEDRIQVAPMIVDFGYSLRSELAKWKDELDELEDQPVDKKRIFDSAKSKAMHLLQRAAQRGGLLQSGHEKLPHTTWENLTEDGTSQQPEIFYIKSPKKKIDAARGYRSGSKSDNKFTVLKGSQVAKELTKSLQAGTLKLRERLLKDGTLTDRGKFYIFTRDCEFDSPSGAAQVVLGTAANGWLVWKNANGTSLKEFFSA